MDTLPRPRASSLRLTAGEREIILTIADDEQSWHVHTESRRAASSRLLRIARALGITPERVGVGYEFSLPLAAVSFRVPRRRRGSDASARRSGRAMTESAWRRKSWCSGRRRYRRRAEARV